MEGLVGSLVYSSVLFAVLSSKYGNNNAAIYWKMKQV